MMKNNDKVRILVLGDSGVGKTSLIHLICYGKPLKKPKWTIGASVNLMLHEYNPGSAMHKVVHIEFWDIGGYSRHSSARSVFYQPINGIILVHDVTNSKSEKNLKRWMAELIKDKTSKANDDFDPELFAHCAYPVLVIGTKYNSDSRFIDKVVMSKSPTNPNCSLNKNLKDIPMKYKSEIAAECFADQILIDCLDHRMFLPGTGNACKLYKFLDKVIKRKFEIGSKISHVNTNLSNRANTARFN